MQNTHEATDCSRGYGEIGRRGKGWGEVPRDRQGMGLSTPSAVSLGGLGLWGRLPTALINQKRKKMYKGKHPQNFISTPRKIFYFVPD